MTKTVKLTDEYIKKIRFLANKTSQILIQQGKNYPTLTGGMFCFVDRANLNVPDTGVRNLDIVADDQNVPIYNLKTDPAGRSTIDLTSIHSTVVATCYKLVDENDTMVMPIAIVDQLVGIVEEVI